MTIVSTKQISRGLLRADAEIRLSSGALPSNDNSIGMQALELLFRLACSPTTAADGLKLLHELQVHQIEIDLQHAQLEAEAREAGQRLDHYKSLYELAPFGYLVIDTQGHISEANAAAAGLLGMDREKLAGLRFENVLAPVSRHLFGELRQQLLAGAARASGVAARCGPGSGPGALQVTASLSPAGDSLLVVLTAA
jgi:PAS domain-containing protein